MKETVQAVPTETVEQPVAAATAVEKEAPAAVDESPVEADKPESAKGSGSEKSNWFGVDVNKPET